MTEENKKCENKKCFVVYIVLILLALNTFFLAGIWCSLKRLSCGMGVKSIFCSWSKKDSTMCPYAMKGSDKGSMMADPKGSMMQGQQK